MNYEYHWCKDAGFIRLNSDGPREFSVGVYADLRKGGYGMDWNFHDPVMWVTLNVWPFAFHIGWWTP